MAKTPTYSFINLNELYNQPLEIDWIVDDIIPNNSIGMVFGPSGSGKSHIVFSMAAMIANGLPWFDKETKANGVLIMAGEGLSGIARRFKAIENEHGITIDQSKLFVSNKAIGVDTFKGIEEVSHAIEELDEPPKLIIIDTLSRHLMKSEENSNDDMARVINQLDQLRVKYECTIVIVHHTGKASHQGARGASALKANVDFSFEVKGKDKECSLTCDKMKDSDDSMPTKHFLIKGVDLGHVGKNGKPITGACIVEHSVKSITLDLSHNKENLALSCFNKDKVLWQTAYMIACKDGIQVESKKKQFRRAVNNLLTSGAIKEDKNGNFVKSKDT